MRHTAIHRCQRTDFVRLPRYLTLIARALLVLTLWAGAQPSQAALCGRATANALMELKFRVETDPFFDGLVSRNDARFPEAIRRLLVMSAQTQSPLQNARDAARDGQIKLGLPLEGGYSAEYTYKADTRAEPLFRLDEIKLVGPDGKRLRATETPLTTNGKELRQDEYSIKLSGPDVGLTGHVLSIHRIPRELGGELLAKLLVWNERLEILRLQDVHAIRNAGTRAGELKLYWLYRWRDNIELFTKRSRNIMAKAVLMGTAFIVVSVLWNEPITFQRSWMGPKNQPANAAVSSAMDTPYTVLESVTQSRSPVASGSEGHYAVMRKHAELENLQARSRVTILAGIDSPTENSTSFFTGAVFHGSGHIVLTSFKNEAEISRTVIISRDESPEVYKIVADLSERLAMKATP